MWSPSRSASSSRLRTATPTPSLIAMPSAPASKRPASPARRQSPCACRTRRMPHGLYRCRCRPRASCRRSRSPAPVLRGTLRPATTRSRVHDAVDPAQVEAVGHPPRRDVEERCRRTCPPSTPEVAWSPASDRRSGRRARQRGVPTSGRGHPMPPPAPRIDPGALAGEGPLRVPRVRERRPDHLEREELHRVHWT